MKKAIKQSTLTNILNGGSILLIAMIAVSFYFSMQISSRMQTAYENRYLLYENVIRFRDASAYLTNQVRAFSATGQVEHYENYWNEVNNLKNRETGVANMREIGITDKEEQLISVMSDISNNLIPLEENAMQLTKDNYFDNALSIVYGKEYEDSVERIDKNMNELLTSIEARTESEVEQCINANKIIQMVTLDIVLVVIVFQIVSLVMVRRRIIGPIKKIRDEMSLFATGQLHSEFNIKPDTSEIGQLVFAIQSTKTELSGYIDEIAHVMAEMANGNFTVSINKDFSGDFEPIQQSIYHFNNSITATLQQIDTAARQLDSNTNQVSESAQSLAQGSTEQAGSVQQLSASLASIAEQARHNTESSEKAVVMANGATQAIHLCNSQMEQLMAAMRDIEEKSGHIRDIIATIDEIAFQTNILALNAAVEAARAGEAGKGFAVVADEVRSLAGKSAEAASSTAALIEETVKAIDNGNLLAKGAANELHNIVGNAVETSSMFVQITNVSKEQTGAIEQINLGVDQIAQVVTANSATSEQNAAAAEELAGLSSIMQQEISKFRLKQNIPAWQQTSLPSSTYHTS